MAELRAWVGDVGPSLEVAAVLCVVMFALIWVQPRARDAGTWLGVLAGAHLMGTGAEMVLAADDGGMQGPALAATIFRVVIEGGALIATARAIARAVPRPPRGSLAKTFE